MLTSKLPIITFVLSCSAIRLPVNLKESDSDSEFTAATESELAAAAASTIPFGFENYNFELDMGQLRPSFARIKTDHTASKVAPQILFTHLLKAGGSSISVMMKELMFKSPGYGHQSVKGDLETQFEENGPGRAKNYDDLKYEKPEMSLRMHSQYFRIGMIRSPCDYLVSIWNFQSSPYGNETGHGRWPRECLQKYYKGDISELYADKNKQMTVEQKDRFQKWVREVGAKNLHYLTYRSYVALHMDPKYYVKSKVFDDGQYYTCLRDHSEAEQKAIQETLMTSDFSQRYDCLIKTESVAQDMQICMKKYAQTITHPEIRETFLQKIENYGKGFERHSNAKAHAQCSEYFDDETTAYVWDREGPFAKKMGYDTCCSK